MAGGHWSLGSFSASFFRLVRRTAAAPVLAALLLTAVAASGAGPAAHANAADFMCDFRVQPRTQNVAISPDLAAAGVSYADVVAAFQPWNDLFMKYHGLPPGACSPRKS